MSSIGKGTKFEKKVFQLIRQQIDQKSFFVQSARMELFYHKKYFSRDRNSNIVVDISLECGRKDAATPNLYVFIECKDYAGPVPVNDLEELYGKILQISGINVKAILYITSVLQEGALNYAISKGIGVVRILSQNKQEWMAERTMPFFSLSQPNTRSNNVINALLNPKYYATSGELVGIFDGKSFTDQVSLLHYFSTLMDQ